MTNTEIFKRARAFDILRDEADAAKSAEAAARLAVTKPKKARLCSLYADMRRLTATYALISRCGDSGECVAAGEWITGSYHLLEQTANALELEQLPRLPLIKGSKGLSRCELIALQLVNGRRGELSPKQLESYLSAFCAEGSLMMREIYALRPWLLATLFRLTSELAFECSTLINMRKKADRAAKNMQKTGRFDRTLMVESCAFVERLAVALRDSPLYDALDAELKREDKHIRVLTEQSHAEQTRLCAELGAAIGSLRTLAEYDWELIFRGVSRVEAQLSRDEAYRDMDGESRAYYRQLVERVSAQTGVSEAAAATAAAEFSQGHAKGDIRSHVGYYLCGEGSAELARKLEPGCFVWSEGGLGVYLTVLLSIAAILLLLTLETARGAFIGIVMLLPSAVCALTAATYLVWRALSLVSPRRLPRLSLREGVPEGARTLVTIPALASGEKRVEELCRQLECHHLATREENVEYCLLLDLPSAGQKYAAGDNELMEYANAGIAALNRRHGKRFYYVFRYRSQNADGEWTGGERKRGALMELNYALLSGKNGFASGSLPEKITYVLTLDADTRVPLGCVKKLIGAMEHPLNRPLTAGNTTVRGYSVIAPRVETTASSASKTLFSRVFATSFGIDGYSGVVSEVYWDYFGRGNFGGKGIYRVKSFAQAVQAIPENAVLSHDMLEGELARCGYASDIQVFEDYPAGWLEAQARAHRWQRGDWQLLPQLSNPDLDGLAKYKLLDNIRRSLFMPSRLALFMAAMLTLSAKWGLLVFLPSLVTLIASVWGKISDAESPAIRLGRLRDFALEYALEATFAFAAMPHEAYVCADAAVRALYRTFVSKRKMLEWTAAADYKRSDTLYGAYARMWFNLPMAALAFFAGAPSKNLIALGTSLIWLLAPAAAHYMARPRRSTEPLSESQKIVLTEYARAAYSYFDELATAKNNFLPPDNYQLEPYRGEAGRTSPTNIGFALCAHYAAYSLGFIELEEAVKRIDGTLATVEKLEKWNGHLYNWYDIKTLLPLNPRYVSTVDSGNFAACCVAVREGLKKAGARSTAQRIDALAENADFSALYDHAKKLFHVGFDAGAGRFSGSYYDLFASEARLTSFTAIAKGDVGFEHWRALDRPLTELGGRRFLLSWSGTMFEYLMARLFIAPNERTASFESERAVTAAQIAAAQGDMPWGVSESGYYAFDLNMNYQYFAFGIDGAGVKTSRGERVVSPYSSALALMTDKLAAFKNLEKLRELGAWGRYGFFEAVDFTPARVKVGAFECVRSFMAHHKGMSLCAYCNVLCENTITGAYMSAPEVRAASLLLDERDPRPSVVIKLHSRALPKLRPERYTPAEASVYAGRQLSPVMCGLSGALKLMASSDGALLCQTDDRLLFPFAQNGKGYAVLLRRSGQSAVCLNACGAHMESGRVTYAYSDGEISVSTRVTAVTDAPVLLQIIEAVNDSQSEVSLQLYEYAEISLAKPEDERAHRTFERLFVQSDITEGIPVFWKRQRRGGESPALAVFWSGREPRMGNDRLKALGRGNTPEHAAFLDGEGLAMQKTPLEPCIAIAQEVRLPKGGRERFVFAAAYGENAAEAVANVKLYRDMEKCEKAFELAWTNAQIQLKYLDITGAEFKAFASAAARAFLPDFPLDCRYAAKNQLSARALWRFGVGEAEPFVLCEAIDAGCAELVRSAAKFCALMRLNGANTRLVVIQCGGRGYESELSRAVKDAFRPYDLENTVVLCREEISEGEYTLLKAAARVDMADYPFARAEIYKVKAGKKRAGYPALAAALPKLEHFNGIGGFDGDEYVMKLDDAQKTPLPWCSILANERFGTLVTESGGGYTWAENSRENKLTRWPNDPVADEMSEYITLRDQTTGAEWSVTPRPAGNGEYFTRHGRGYTVFESGAQSLKTITTVLTAAEESVKLIKIELYNPIVAQRTLTLTYRVRWQNGALEPDALMHGISAECASAVKSGERLTFIAAPGRQVETKTNACEGWLANDGTGKNCASRLSTVITLEENARAELLLVMGTAKSREELRYLCEKFASPADFDAELEKVSEIWNERLGKIRVRTGDKAFDRLMNGLLLYQVYSSRLLSRTGYYQCGGAFGFRDQLQDVLALLITDPSRAREQIVMSAKHQFEDGDVMHWWHEPYRGVRTKISDDLLFLPYCAARYAETTGDESLWNESVCYLKNVEIPEGQSDVYAEMQPSELCESVFEHCVRAIQRACVFGAHGLPAMGGGDWNDGMDEVRGESVFVGWLLYKALCDMGDAGEKRGDERAANWRSAAKELKQSIEKHAWDGAWYKRAFFEDGTPIGSAECAEASIDSVAQSWAALSGGGDAGRTRQALSEATKRLVDAQNGVIKLLDPPFDAQEPRAGYIQGYAPGLRENGGQYTHAAAWLALAEREAGNTRAAWQLYSMINPIRHGDNPIITRIYKGEPYAVAGDVYSNPEHAGRCGWTHYTGSAAWLYVSGLKLLGFEKRGESLLLDSASVEVIGGYEITYLYGAAKYRIKYKNAFVKQTIPLDDDGRTHEITL